MKEIVYNNQPIQFQRKPITAWGEHDGTKRLITIASRIKDDDPFYVEVILHELMHAIIHEHLGLCRQFKGPTDRRRNRAQERVVDTLARDLVVILRQNPELQSLVHLALGSSAMSSGK